MPKKTPVSWKRKRRKREEIYVEFFSNNDITRVPMDTDNFYYNYPNQQQ